MIFQPGKKKSHWAERGCKRPDGSSGEKLLMAGFLTFYGLECMSSRPQRNRQSSGSLDGSNFVKSRQRSRASSEGSHSDVSLSEPTSVPQSSSQSAGSRDIAPAEGSISENPVVQEHKPTSNRQKPEEGDGSDEFKDAIDSRIPTFFSVMSSR